MNNRSTNDGSRNRFRIIGGQWRSRKLNFPGDIPSLRPTPDRIRETLFNWLQLKVPGAHCLDLFAGSGALALEALSRHAATATAVDLSPGAISALRNNANVLECQDLTTVTADSLNWLRQQAGKARFDIIFLDPPFSLDLLPECLALIDAGSLAAPGCVIYLESSDALEKIKLPSPWQLTRSKRAGQVFFGICENRIELE